MQDKPFESLAEFATDDIIIRLIAKERGKYAAKSNGSGTPFKSDSLFSKLQEMTPPHKLWANPGRGKLPKRAEHGLGRWMGRRKRAATRVYRAIFKYRNVLHEEPWVQKLNEFILSIQESLEDDKLVLETPVILAKFKEQDVVTGDFIYRPICKYSDLKTKIILALAYRYILAKFDKYFHPNMLFMRAPRRINSSDYVVPKFLDAIDMVSKYRREKDGRPIYVGECDIQKFYDIFNHDVIMDCFEDLFDEAKKNDGASDADFDSLRRVIRAYLDSYNYPEHVLGKNNDLGYWKAEVRRRKSEKNPDPVCRFKWVKEEAFVSSGCYTKDEFLAAKEGKKLGIPQGGALSGIMVNVVMRKVDQPIVADDDPERLFIRYCDDILLMHTNRQKCIDDLETYYRQLVDCKLVPHPRKDVDDFKSGDKTRSGFWHAKSKNVYLWGSGDGNASDWVAFVGYEMRRTGEIRIRKDKIDSEFKRIARRYYDIIKSKVLTSGDPLTIEQQEKLMSRMDSLADHILDFELAGNNVYTRSQARRLDKYLYHKSRQAARKIGVEDLSKAARERTTYLQKVKEKE